MLFLKAYLNTVLSPSLSEAVTCINSLLKLLFRLMPGQIEFTSAGASNLFGVVSRMLIGSVLSLSKSFLHEPNIAMTMQAIHAVYNCLLIFLFLKLIRSFAD